MKAIRKILISLLVMSLCAFSSMGQGGGGQPNSGIPEITFIDFPKLIPPDGTRVIGTIGFRDPDADIVSVEFAVAKAVAFTPFSFNPNVKGKVEGIFQFFLFSELGQQVSLRVTLKDEKGNESQSKVFSFIAGKPLTPQIVFLMHIDNGQFDLPRGVAVDSAGFIYIADTGNHRIQKFGPNKQLLTKWGSFCDLLQKQGCVDPDGEGPLELGDGQFALPQGIALDSAGNVYVADFGNARIQKFDANGKFLTKWGSLGAGEGQFHEPRGIAVDSRGNVYVVDSGNHRVQKFSPAGAFLAKWGIPGNEDGQFFLPFGIAIDSQSNVYVADALNHRIQKFAAGGKFLTQWGRLGKEDGLFNAPTGIAIDADGNIYVADSVNSRLQKFAALD